MRNWAQHSAWCAVSHECLVRIQTESSCRRASQQAALCSEMEPIHIERCETDQVRGWLEIELDFVTGTNAPFESLSRR